MTGEQQQQWAVIRVRDTGKGISPDLLARLFDPFAQSERPLDRSEGGLGIGLTLARRLAELHGGTIEAFSAGSGKGSEFVVRLPLASGAARGQSRARMTTYALWRAVALILLGVFLRSIGHAKTYWTFEDTLSQIGLAVFGGSRPLVGYGVERAALRQGELLRLSLYWAAAAPMGENALAITLGAQTLYSGQPTEVIDPWQK